MTVIIQGPEAIEVAIANTISSNIASTLSAISAAWASYDATQGVTVPLQPPALVYAGRLDVVREFPTVMVTSVDGDEYEDMAPVSGTQSHRLDVSCWLVSDSETVLDRLTKRYLVAIWRILKLNQPLDYSLSNLIGVATKRYGKSAIYKTKEGQLQQVAAWQVQANVIEQL